MAKDLADYYYFFDNLLLRILLTKDSSERENEMFFFKRGESRICAILYSIKLFNQIV